MHSFGESWSITSVCNPQNGTATISDSCFTYTPAINYFGNDTFCLVVCDSAGCDTTEVIMTVINPNIKAFDDCGQDSTYANTPIIINVLANDSIPAAAHIVVSIKGKPNYATVATNDDNSITYTPNENFIGYDEFSYQVCAITGSYKFCDTARVCVNVIDTTQCFIPNGFSPNGDGVHDTYVIPCNVEYPKAELRVYNRWGDEVWYSNGAYNNDWDGRNSNGVALPDATYYIIYSYNDGTGRQKATIVISQR